jgi:hypothetical protein
MRKGALDYGNPTNRPAIATVDHSERETPPTTLGQTGFKPVPTAIATRRRIEKVNTNAINRVAIFSQKTGR